MKVTTKTVSDRITLLENQKTLSINEENTLKMLRWGMEQFQRAEAAESECTRLDRESQNLNDQLGACDRERRDFRAKLAELEQQESAINLPELIEGMTVSVDVSTCDADSGNRYFGTVAECTELETGKHGLILLVQDAEPNFTRPVPAVSLADLVSEAVYTCTGCNHTSFHLPSSCDCGTEGARFIQHTAYLSPIAEQKGSERG